MRKNHVKSVRATPQKAYYAVVSPVGEIHCSSLFNSLAVNAHRVSIMHPNRYLNF